MLQRVTCHKPFLLQDFDAAPIRLSIRRLRVRVPSGMVRNTLPLELPSTHSFLREYVQVFGFCASVVLDYVPILKEKFGVECTEFSGMMLSEVTVFLLF